MSFSSGSSCGDCRHWLFPRWHNARDVGTCGLRNRINGHDMTVRTDWCEKWESKDSGPIAGTLAYLEADKKARGK